jgi:hypothetical protein
MAAAPRGMAARELPREERQALARLAVPLMWPGFSLIAGSERPLDPVHVAGCDPAWAASFAGWRERVAAALGATAQRIEHVGSTSVPGLAAKPVVDIQVSAASLAAGQICAATGGGRGATAQPRRLASLLPALSRPATRCPHPRLRGRRRLGA